jgi:hypothetical protein
MLHNGITRMTGVKNGTGNSSIWSHEGMWAPDLRATSRDAASRRDKAGKMKIPGSGQRRRTLDVDITSEGSKCFVHN